MLFCNNRVVAQKQQCGEILIFNYVNEQFFVHKNDWATGVGPNGFLHYFVLENADRLVGKK